MSDNIVDFKSGRKTNDEDDTTEVRKVPQRVYEVCFEDGEQFFVTGYLGVTPIFAGIMDEHEKIKFMCPPSSYKYIRYLLPEELDELKQLSLFPEVSDSENPDLGKNS